MNLPQNSDCAYWRLAVVTDMNYLRHSSARKKILQALERTRGGNGAMTIKDLAIIHAKDKGWTITEEMAELHDIGLGDKIYHRTKCAVRSIISNYNDYTNDKVRTDGTRRNILYWLD